VPLQLTRKRIAITVALATACSDAKPRPVVETPDASADANASAPVVDAGVDASCTLPGEFGSSACNECTAATCCNHIAACEADKDCKARVACMLPCFDAPDAGACAKTCEDTYPDDRGIWYDLWGCVYFNPPCETHCSSTR
jgi:hypothetical protein